MAATTHSPAVSDQARAARVVVVGDGPLTIDDVVDVARHGARVRLADAAAEAFDRDGALARARSRQEILDFARAQIDAQPSG